MTLVFVSTTITPLKRFVDLSLCSIPIDRRIWSSHWLHSLCRCPSHSSLLAQLRRWFEDQIMELGRELESCSSIVPGHSLWPHRPTRATATISCASSSIPRIPIHLPVALLIVLSMYRMTVVSKNPLVLGPELDLSLLLPPWTQVGCQCHCLPTPEWQALLALWFRW